MVYRGWTIEKYEGTQVGYNTERSTLSRVGIGTKRKYKGYEAFYPDNSGSKVFDTLKAAKAYIDAYEGT